MDLFYEAIRHSKRKCGIWLPPRHPREARSGRTWNGFDMYDGLETSGRAGLVALHVGATAKVEVVAIGVMVAPHARLAAMLTVMWLIGGFQGCPWPLPVPLGWCSCLRPLILECALGDDILGHFLEEEWGGDD